MLISVSLSAQWATYTPQQTPQIRLPQQSKPQGELQLEEWQRRRSGSQQEQSTQRQTIQEQTTQVTGYQYDSHAQKWYRIGLKLLVEEGIGSSEILTIVGIKEGQYWKDIQPLRANSISNRESEFSYYVNLVGGTVYFNY